MEGITDQQAANPETGHWYVKDRNARPPGRRSDGSAISNDRVHTLLVNGIEQAFLFTYNQPTELAEAQALVFLKDPSFVRTDDKGAELVFRNPPKQPHELEAGERFRLEPRQTVADLDELTVDALKVRAARLPGGDKMLRANKADLVTFITEAGVLAQASRAAAPERSATSDEFLPTPEADDQLNALFQSEG